MRALLEALRRARARRVRRQPRVHEQPVRDQPARGATPLDAADRAFRFKAAVKDVAAQRGLLATFMGKPFNDQGGSGTHLHISLEPRRRATPSPATTTTRRASRAELRHFVGRRARARPGADGVPQPDGQRLPADPARLASRRPTPTGARQPHHVRAHPARARRRDAASRSASATAPPTRTSAIAASLFAGLDGVRARARRRGEPLAGDAYTLPEDRAGGRCRRRSTTALDALEADEVHRATRSGPRSSTRSSR